MLLLLHMEPVQTSRESLSMTPLPGFRGPESRANAQKTACTCPPVARVVALGCSLALQGKVGDPAVLPAWATSTVTQEGRVQAQSRALYTHSKDAEDMAPAMAGASTQLGAHRTELSAEHGCTDTRTLWTEWTRGGRKGEERMEVGGRGQEADLSDFLSQGGGGGGRPHYSALGQAWGQRSYSEATGGGSQHYHRVAPETMAGLVQRHWGRTRGLTSTALSGPSSGQGNSTGSGFLSGPLGAYCCQLSPRFSITHSIGIGLLPRACSAWVGPALWGV